MSKKESVVSRMMQALFSRQPEKYKVMILGNEAWPGGVGKTTILYQLKLGEVIKTTPTMGFNVEDVTRSGSKIEFWDVGGGDRMRPLLRVYYPGTQAFIFVIDSSSDSDGLINPTPTDDPHAIYADAGLKLLLSDEELRDASLLILANKQDLPGAASVEQLTATLGLESIMREDELRWGRRRLWHIQGCSAVSGHGLYEGFDWLVAALKNPGAATVPTHEANPGRCLLRPSCSEPVPSEALKSASEQEADRLQALLLEWLSRPDLPEDEFLQHMDAATLDRWDHYSNLRTAWLYLTRLGRREGIKRIFAVIPSFLERSPLTRPSHQASEGTLFNETLTYFWAHMVDYGMSSTRNADGEFKTFLLLNPHLVNDSFFLHYYSNEQMLLTAEARTSVVLPDLRPLPSLIPQPTNVQPLKALDERLKPREAYSDAQFLVAACANSLPAWGHEPKMRLIYLLLVEQLRANGRRDADQLLEVLRTVEKSGFHMTINYFWLQLVTQCIVSVAKRRTEGGGGGAAAAAAGDRGPADHLEFDEFFRHPECRQLCNALLYEKYYSHVVISAENAAREMVLPNLRSFQSTV